jgi:hypothetical protein
VAAFLLAFALCGMSGIEAWPLTGWRLFSHVRTMHQTGWRAVAVDASGRERRIAFGELSTAFKSFTLIMNGFDSLPPDRKRSTCRAWADAVRRSGQPIESLRIYRLAWDLLPRRAGRPTTVPAPTLAYRCDAPA